MKHRVFLCNDLRDQLPTYQARLGCSQADFDVALNYLFANDILFEDGNTFFLNIFNAEERLRDPLIRRLYCMLRDLCPVKLLPAYGINWPTFKERFLRLWEQTYNIIINKIPSHNLRLWWLRMGGAKIGKGSTLWRNTEVIGMESLVIGEDTVVGWHCQLDARCGLFIGNHVAIASYVIITSGTHDLQDPAFSTIAGPPIRIGDYAWLCSRCMLGYNAKIGEGAVVTANTVVAKEIAPYKIVGGTGAKVMGERCRDLNYRTKGKGLFYLLY